MPELEDTQPLPIPGIHNQLGWDIDGDGEIGEFESKVPSPAILRGVLFALANLAGLIAGHELLNPEVLERIISVYGIVGPVALGYWIHRGTSRK